MKVSELIQKLTTMDPDKEVRVLVVEDDHLTVYGNDVVGTTVARMTEVSYSLDAHVFEEERENGTL